MVWNGPFPDANEFPYPRLLVPTLKEGGVEYDIYQKRLAWVYKDAGDEDPTPYLYWEKVT